MMNIVERWQELNRITNEGSTGVKNLEQLCKNIGYGDDYNFYESNPLVAFFADNPDAIDTISNWIAENISDEQRESLIASLPYQEPTIEGEPNVCPDCDCEDFIEELESIERDSTTVPVKTCNKCGEVWFVHN